MRRLFVTDLDGTLLTPESRVSDESARIISELSREGALITVATARTPATLEPLLRDVYTSIPAIVLTGASMWDRNSRLFTDTVYLPDGEETRLIGMFREAGVSPFVYTVADDRRSMRVFHDAKVADRDLRFYAERKELPLKNFIFSDAEMRAGHDNVVLLLGICPTVKAARLSRTMNAGAGGLSVSSYPDIFNPDVSYIEVFRAGVSKARAVEKLREMTGAGHVTVYGDSINDLSMFAVADEAVAPANAMPEVIARADRVIGPNSAPSVAMDILREYSR